MKRLLALLGICFLLIFSFAGCGDSAPESEMDESAAEEAMDTAAEDAGSLMDEAQDTAEEAAEDFLDEAQEAADELID